MGHDVDTHEEPALPGDRISARECLAGRVADKLRRQGFYLTHVVSGRCQTVIDVQWAALLAGRVLGRRTRTYASAAGKRVPDQITVVVTLVQDAASPRSEGVPAMLAELLDADDTGAGAA